MDERAHDADWWRALMAHAPISFAVLGGASMRVELADGELGRGLFGGAAAGDAARESIAVAVGDDWVNAIDEVRASGTGHRGTCLIAGRIWEVWVERLAADRVGVYARREEDGPTRAMTHRVRNAVYGIRAAVGVLLRRDLDDEVRRVLGQVAATADDAERGIASVERHR